MTDRERFKELLHGCSLDTEADVDHVVELLLAAGATFSESISIRVFNNETKAWEKV